ncbi:MAG: exosortase system-associated protein, TIGR04073 family [Nitrospira sp.]
MRYHNESNFDLQGNGRVASLMPVACASRLLMAMALVVGLSGTAQAQSDEPQTLGHQVSGKFIRGVVNLSTGWVEVPRQIYEVGTNEGWVRGILRGPFDGIGMFFARTVAGVVEVATFPVPLPTYKPMLTPAYAWESEDPSDVMAADRKK